MALAWAHYVVGVFQDIGMPGEDGYEVAREPRGQPQTRRAVRAALTGWGAPPGRI